MARYQPFIIIIIIIISSSSLLHTHKKTISDAIQ